MGREEHCKQISLACVGSARSVWTTLGLPQLTAPVLSQSTLLRLQVALKGNCPKWALRCMHFPGLSCLGSGSRVLHKGTDLVGPAFCALSLVRETQAIGCLVSSHSQAGGASDRLPCPSCSVFWVYNRRAFSGVPCVSSGELISGCDCPGNVNRPQSQELLVSNGTCLQFGRRCLFGSAIVLFWLWLPPTCLSLVEDEQVCSLLALLWYSLSPFFCE